MKTLFAHPNCRLFAIALMAILTSCMSFKSVTPPPSEVFPTLRKNDKVQILLKNGQEIKKMKVKMIDSSKIEGIHSSTLSSFMISEIKAIAKTKDTDGVRQNLCVIEPGSIIRVKLKDGSTLRRLEVLSITDDRIMYSEVVAALSKTTINQNVLRFSDISSIKVRVHDHNKTMELIVTPFAIAGFLIAGWTALIASSFGG